MILLREDFSDLCGEYIDEFCEDKFSDFCEEDHGEIFDVGPLDDDPDESCGSMSILYVVSIVTGWTIDDCCGSNLCGGRGEIFGNSWL